MKNLIFFLAVLTAVFFTSCDEVEEGAYYYCHTELVPAPLETAVVGDADVIRTGQSIAGIVKDHSKEVSGYTREMFLADNPHIAERKPVTKLDPCDSTKVKWRSIPVHTGDTIYLRHPLRIDTIPGDGGIVVWKAAESGRLRHIIDMDDEGRFIVHDNSFVCDNSTTDHPTEKEEIILPPSDDEAGVVSPFKGDSSGFSDFIGNIPNWFWNALGLTLFVCLFIARQHRKTREVVNGHTTTDGNQTRERVTTAESRLRKDVIADGEQTRSGLKEVATSISEQTTAVKAQTEAMTKSSNELLEAIRKQGGLSGKV